MDHIAGRLVRLEAELMEAKRTARQAAETARLTSARLTALECLARAVIETHPDAPDLSDAFSCAVGEMLRKESSDGPTGEELSRACIDVLRWLSRREDPGAFE